MNAEPLFHLYFNSFDVNYKLSAAGQIVDWQFPRKIQHWKTNFKTNGQWLRESEFNWKFVRWGIYKNKCKLTQKVAGRKLLKKKAARCAFFVIDAKEWPHQGLLDGHESKLFYFYFRSTSSGGSRSGTPNRSIGPGSSTNSSSQLRNYVFNSSGTPAAYKYFSRSEFYNSTAIYNRNINADNTKLKTVKTDDLDVNQPKDRQREHAIPGQIKRDTAANIAGGKQVLKQECF